jgi:hypothetical protein
MTYEIYIQSIKALEADATKWSDKLQALKGSTPHPMGLTPDHIKFSPEFQEAKKCYSVFHNGIRKLNGLVPKAYLKRRASERWALKTR